MSDLLKSAIADAKAVRATALANAKAALEEAFAPKLQSMLATKLQQEVEDDTGAELPEEPAAPADAPVTDEVPVADAPSPSPVGTEVGAEVGSDDLGGLGSIGDSPEPAVADIGSDASVGADFGGSEEEQLPTDAEMDEVLGQGHVNPVDATEVFTEEKASPDYKKTSKGAKTEDPQGTNKERANGPGKADKKVTTGSLTSKGGTTKASTDYKKTTSGHKTEDPQGTNKERANGPGKADKNITGKVLEETDDISNETLDEILKELESEVAGENCGAETFGADAPGGEAPVVQSQDESDEEIDLSSLLESDDSDSDDKEDKAEKEDSDEDDKDSKKPAWLKENISLKKELKEYRSAVQYLRDRINEVNLLNAKLLYTNKLFKQATLTNEQKLKVIEQFDLTKSVREAKITYANMSETLNFGGKKNVNAPAPVARKAAIVKTIAEGFASKVVASTKPTKAVITEGAEMANRFKKLAGIRSK